jgi:hypothetical protein
MGCCNNCCGCLSNLLVKLTAFIIFLSGLGITGYGLFLLIKHSSGVSGFVLAVGGYATICGAIGLCLSCKKAPFYTTRLYVVLLMLAALVQGSVAAALKIDKGWTEKMFDTKVCSGDHCDQDTDSWIDSHEDRIFYVLLFAAALEFFASCLACCYSTTHYEDDNYLEADEYGDRYSSSFRTSGTGVECRRPLTQPLNTDSDAHISKSREFIDKMRAKFNIPEPSASKRGAANV